LQVSSGGSGAPALFADIQFQISPSQPNHVGAADEGAPELKVDLRNLTDGAFSTLATCHTKNINTRRKRNTPKNGQSLLQHVVNSDSDNYRSKVSSTLKELNESSVGRRVLVGGEQKGLLRFFGRTHFQPGLWCGIELDEPVGRHAGQVEGVDYFACAPNRGIFAPLHKVQLEVNTNQEAHRVGASEEDQGFAEEEEESPSSSVAVEKTSLRRQSTFVVENGDSHSHSQSQSQSTTMESRRRSALPTRVAPFKQDNTTKQNIVLVLVCVAKCIIAPMRRQRQRQ
jgi:hypothetical protein